MLGFWIALCVVVVGVLAAMGYYALKVWAPDLPSSQAEANLPFPRSMNGHPKGCSDSRARTGRAGRRAR